MVDATEPSDITSAWKACKTGLAASIGKRKKADKPSRRNLSSENLATLPERIAHLTEHRASVQYTTTSTEQKSSQTSPPDCVDGPSSAVNGSTALPGLIPKTLNEAALGLKDCEDLDEFEQGTTSI